MTNHNDTAGAALVLSHDDTATTTAVVHALEHNGWQIRLANTTESLSEVGYPLRAVVYLPGLLSGAHSGGDPAAEFIELLEAVAPVLPSADGGGARVVAVSSRDWLGWPTRPRAAGAAAGLIATVRSLALAYGRAGITVNAVVGMPLHANTGHAREPAPGTHLFEPSALTGEPVSAEDIAHTVAFFLDRRSGYLTGQVLHCCGGASLLSSLSA